MGQTFLGENEGKNHDITFRSTLSSPASPIGAPKTRISCNRPIGHHYVVQIKISTFLHSKSYFLVNETDAARARKLEKLDKIKKRPDKRPDWNELMREIDSFRFGSSSQKLKKVACNDRSKPMLTKTKIQGKVSTN